MNNEMKTKYNEYLTNHISAVKTAFDWLLEYLPAIFEGYDADYVGSHFIKTHDRSKYSEEEYDAYCEYFYGDEKTDEVKEDFDKAWLHHQHNNPHHWQHWLLQKDNGGVEPLAMPFNYVIEMICDWWSFSWNNDNLYEIFDWYKKQQSDMVLHPETEEQVTHILDLIKKKLDEINDGNKE